MKKRIVSVLLASVLTLSCLAGCGNSGNDSTSGDSTPAADTTEDTTDTAEGDTTESVGAQITVDESATDNVCSAPYSVKTLFSDHGRRICNG